MLLDFIRTGTTGDKALDQGLLHAGLALLQGRGNFGANLGRAGMQALMGAQDYRQNQFLQSLQKNQLEEIQRKRVLEDLPGQFIKPAQTGVDATGGMETATTNPANYVPPQMDLAGLAQKYLGTPGGLQTGLALQRSLAKDTTPIKVGAGDTLVNPQTLEPVYTAPSKVEEGQFIQLLRAAGIDPASPQGKALLAQRLQKEATHQPAASINNFGSPLPIALPGGQQGYIQPPTRPGGPSQVLTIPGTNDPAIKPTDQREKDLTEAQAKATTFLGQMRSASDVLKRLNADQTALSMQAETALAGGPMNAVIGQKAQQVRQAQDQWSEAFLRFKTGAASTPAEVAANRKTFFPVVGDKPDAIKQKAEMRAQAERDMEVAAGRGAKQLNERDGVKRYNPATGKIE